MTKDAGRGEAGPLADVLDWWNDGAGKEPPYRSIGKVLREAEQLREAARDAYIEGYYDGVEAERERSIDPRSTVKERAAARLENPDD